MPCDCSHLEARAHEVERRRAAQVLAWGLRKLGRRVPTTVAHAASDYYGETGDREIDAQGALWLTQQACAFYTGLSQQERERLLYGNPKDKDARAAADWWEAHEAADKARLARERAARRRRF